MGLPSDGQLRAAKVAMKNGRHHKILVSKKAKHKSQQERKLLKKLKKKADAEANRSRSTGKEDKATSEVRSQDVAMESSKTVVRGQGSGTPGARYAAAKLEMAVQVSKRGGRRRKPTARSMGRR
eukprot:TRINITY_DN4535_c0_g1_i1.p3 TRINITY_DN4535_c0_g1~~TRINITY_DN4535_c0_g1_i1.p3  ORF type:complete len:124 (+),score=27.08 TRINITY_DN4535_c0_g1_i1:65-436(+)